MKLERYTILFVPTILLGISLTEIDNFYMPNPCGMVSPPEWVDASNRFSYFISLPDGNYVFADYAVMNVFIYRRENRIITELTEEHSRIVYPYSIYSDYPYLWVCDLSTHRISRLLIDETIKSVENFSPSDLAFIPMYAVPIRDKLVIAGSKSILSDERDSIINTQIQVYNYTTGVLLSEDTLSAAEYNKYISGEGFGLSHSISYFIAPFDSGFLFCKLYKPEVVYFSLELDTLAIIDATPQSYEPPTKFVVSFETPDEEIFDWLKTWTLTGHLCAYNDSLAVVCYQLNGYSELAFFNPIKNKIIGFTEPTKGSLMDVDEHGRLLFLTKEMDKEAVKMTLYEVDFDD